MDALIFAETVFYFVASLAIIVLGTLSALVVYFLVLLAKNLSNLSYNLDLAVTQLKESTEKSLTDLSSNLGQNLEEIMEKIKSIIDSLSDLPILSLFLKSKNNKKGRK